MATFEVDVGSVTSPLPIPGSLSPLGTIIPQVADAAGRTSLASDDVFMAILVELRIITQILAQRCGVTEDLAAMRADNELQLI